MKKNNKSKNNPVRIQLALLSSVVSVTVLSGVVLSSSVSKAATEFVDNVTVTVPESCTMGGEIKTGKAHTATLTSGVNTPNIGETELTATCNDAGGFSIMAVGFSNDTEGNTDMISSINSAYNIHTGTGTSDTSSWAMKVTPGTGLVSEGNFNNYNAVPASYKKVARKESGVAIGDTVSAKTTYQVYVSQTQPAGSYVGKVKYTIVNPSTIQCPSGYTLVGGACKK